jgi:hypothetical protein
MNHPFLIQEIEHFTERFPLAKNSKIFEIVETTFTPHTTFKNYSNLTFNDLYNFLTKIDCDLTKQNKRILNRQYLIRFNINDDIFNLYSILIKKNGTYAIREESTFSEMSFFLAEHNLMDGFELSLKVLLSGKPTSNAHKNILKTFIHDYLKSIRGGTLGISEIKTSIKEFSLDMNY